MTEQQKQYHFHVDGKKYPYHHSSLTGADVKKQANVPPTHQLFLESHGQDPDRAISDGEAIDLSGEEKHFYAVPPATFGA